MHQKGFTLIEILVVVGMIVMLFTVGSFIDMGSLNKNLVSTEESTLISVLSKARSRAMNNVDHVAHGVHIDTDSYTIFEGSTYTAGASTNEEIPKNSKAIITGLNDFYFNQLSGNPSSTGIIQLSDGITTKTINIKTGGLLDW
ncbi:prepilin-type N-terminal cleavage/methylation domain-containing protein [Patescibacteria group bacterium]|nr:prepilin-type N-terminal cleavage/methylation domain-containing protein [Patescibacteria group bacterium]